MERVVVGVPRSEHEDRPLRLAWRVLKVGQRQAQRQREGGLQPGPRVMMHELLMNMPTQQKVTGGPAPKTPCKEGRHQQLETGG